MDTGMITIAVVLTAIVLMPFFLITANAKKKTKQLINQLHELALKKGSTVTKTVVQGKCALGLDESGRCLFFLKKTSEIEQFKWVDLKNVKSCTVQKRSRTIKLDKTLNEIMESVALSFTLSNNDTEIFELYNEEECIQLGGEILVAEEWKNKVDTILKSKSTAPEKQTMSHSTFAIS